MFTKKTIDDVDIAGKTVLFRPEYNVPVKDGRVLDDFRIDTAMPTLQKLLDENCKVVIACSLGRPKGKVDPELDLQIVAHRLGEKLSQSVEFVDAHYGEEVSRAVANLEPGSVLMLQNMRFDPREESNDPEFARLIVDSVKPDLIVQEAFGNSHRNHATMTGINKYAPSVAGYLVRDEVTTIKSALAEPKRPFVAIVGGAKLETKIPVMEQLIEVADTLIVGGAMANTFFVAQGLNVGKSLYGEEGLDEAKRVMELCESNKTELILPSIDVGVAQEIDETAERMDVSVEEVGDMDIILDIGPRSTEKMLEALKDAGQVVWNGPLGMMELPKFAQSSKIIAEFIAENIQYSIIGGGDTADFVDELGIKDKFGFVSTGGGASLDLMAGKSLPAVEALLDK
jgi:phosphoglycerate kinase